MTEKVLVEVHDNTTEDQLKSALPCHMELEHIKDNSYFVYVQEARDGEDEVTAVLENAGIHSYVEGEN